MPTRQWVFDPNSGGKKIPPVIQAAVEKRIQKVAEEQFKGHYTRLDSGYSVSRPVLLYRCVYRTQNQ